MRKKGAPIPVAVKVVLCEGKKKIMIGFLFSVMPITAHPAFNKVCRMIS